MKENMDHLEQKLREEFDRFAREEEKALGENGGFIMPEGKKEELYAAIREKAGEKSRKTDGDVQSADTDKMVDEDGRKRLSVVADKKADGLGREQMTVDADGIVDGVSREVLSEVDDGMADENSEERLLVDARVAGGRIAKRNLYAELSEEDLKALELGRKIMEKEAHEEFRVKTLKKKKRRRVYIGLVAALVTTLALGVTSMGGAKRVIMMMTQIVGDREIIQVDSREDNLVIEENEEKAYQKIKEKYGIEPVRIVYKTDALEFVKMEFDEEIQTAELFYEYDKESIVYLINASYNKMSWGIDSQDKLIKTVKKNIDGCLMEIKEYKILENNGLKYSANFKYNELEYYLVGNVEEEKFYNILKNLYFYHDSR